jgi:hypothetical protein
MTEDDTKLERALAEAMAPVDMPASLRERLLRIPEEHPQQPTATIIQLPRRDNRADKRRPSSAGSLRSRLLRKPIAIGLTSSLSAAAASLLLGIFVGAGLVADQTAGSEQAGQVADATSEGSALTDPADADAVAIIYAAADMPGVLP